MERSITHERTIWDWLSYSTLLRALVKLTFPWWQAIGLHLSVNTYDEPIPDTRRLDGSLWTRTSELPGIDMNESRQVTLLTEFSARFKAEYDSFPVSRTRVPYQFYLNNRFFPPIDAEVLYCMIRYFRPRRIVEIGSGNSTYLAAQAIQKNRTEDPTYECQLTAIEPRPNAIIRGGFPGLTRLIATPVQEVPLSEFAELAANDILFIDSSHMLRIGSDVQHEYLEILPRLQPGVLIHVHDIFLPFEYRKDWILNHYRFFNEQYLLQAFLTFNDGYEVLWAGTYLFFRRPDILEAAFQSYRANEDWNGRRTLPGSFWMRRVARPSSEHR